MAYCFDFASVGAPEQTADFRLRSPSKLRRGTQSGARDLVNESHGDIASALVQSSVTITSQFAVCQYNHRDVGPRAQPVQQ
jgi:hypothetical protein